MEFEELYKIAKNKANPWQISKHTIVGKVGTALLTDRGNVYTGIDINVPCAIGFCAEHSAIASMLEAGENRIVKAVSVSAKYGIIAPCGRCREFMYQINPENLKCEILLKDGTKTLDELLPDRWK